MHNKNGGKKFFFRSDDVTAVKISPNVAAFSSHRGVQYNEQMKTFTPIDLFCCSKGGTVCLWTKLEDCPKVNKSDVSTASSV